MNTEKNDDLKLSSADQAKRFEQLENELSKTTADDVGNLCELYHKIKPFLQDVLPIIRLIPVYGKTIADAIEFLMKIADMACPVG